MITPKKGECPLRCLVLPLLTYLVAAGTDYIHSVLLNKPLNCCNFQRVTSADWVICGTGCDYLRPVWK